MIEVDSKDRCVRVLGLGQRGEPDLAQNIGGEHRSGNKGLDLRTETQTQWSGRGRRSDVERTLEKGFGAHGLGPLESAPPRHSNPVWVQTRPTLGLPRRSARDRADLERDLMVDTVADKGQAGGEDAG